MECLQLTWSFVLDNKKILVVGLSQSGCPTILLRTLDCKREFFFILADWQLLMERLLSLQEHFRPNAKKRKSSELEDIKICGTHFDSITRGRVLELCYKRNWLDILLARPPQGFMLTGNEVLALIKLHPQIQHSLEVMQRPPADQSTQVVFSGSEENFEELMSFLTPKINSTSTSHPLPS